MPYAAEAATASAANPEADEAIPQPVGKLFCDATRARSFRPAIRRTRSRKRPIRSADFPPGGAPSSRISSREALSSRSATVVVVTQAESVIEMLGFSGRLSAPGRFPQYLMNAILAPASAVTFEAKIHSGKRRSMNDERRSASSFVIRTSEFRRGWS